MFFCFCCGCDIGSDTFDATLSNWEDIVGATTSGGLLVLDEGDAATFTPAPSSATAPIKLILDPLTTETTAALRVYLSQADADNRLFVEYTIEDDAGTIRGFLRIWGETAGIEYEISDARYVTDTDEDLEERHEIEICVTPLGEVEAEEVVAGEFPAADVEAESGWFDGDNVLVDDSSYARFPFPSSGSAESTTNLALHVNFGTLAPPPGATIDGMSVRTWAQGTPSGATVVDLKAQVVWSGGTLDDKAVGTTIPDAFTEVGYGDATDDWGGLTAAIVREGFTFLLQYQRTNAFTGGEVRVEFVDFTINFTTLAGDRLGVVVRYHNSDASTDSISGAGVTTGGTATGIEAVTGDWNVDTWTLEYGESETRPTCGTCGDSICHSNCCDTEIDEPFLVVDFGSGHGGLFEDEHVLSNQTGQSHSPCLWFDVDSVTINDDPGWVAAQASPAGHISPFKPTAGCHWAVATNQGTNSAIYWSAQIAEPGDCGTYPAFPMTLTKYFGSGPATITLDVP